MTAAQLSEKPRLGKKTLPILGAREGALLAPGASDENTLLAHEV